MGVLGFWKFTLTLNNCIEHAGKSADFTGFLELERYNRRHIFWYRSMGRSQDSMRVLGFWKFTQRLNNSKEHARKTADFTGFSNWEGAT